MEKGLISVVVTSFERQYAMLKQCLDSVMAQTWKRIEIVLVDDNPPGSPYKAELARLPEAYPPLRLIVHEKNMGAQRSRNDGIRAARGEFVAFLDDDDAWLPEKLEKQAALFADPSVGLVYCMGYQTSGELTDRSRLYSTSAHFRTEATHALLLYDDCIGSTSQAVIRASCFAVTGLFDETLPARQDYEMWLRLTRDFRAVGVPQPLFIHRMHAQSGQISRSADKARRGYELIYEKYKEEYLADRRTRALYLWQMSSHQLFEGTAFRRRTRLRALATHPVAVLQKIMERKRNV